MRQDSGTIRPQERATSSTLGEGATGDPRPPMTHHSTLRAANSARQKEWDTDNSITLAYRGNELAGEVGEACNVIKKLERERLGIRGSRASAAQLAEELADVVICADLIAMDAGIDLDRAVRAKFNSTSQKYGLQTRLSEHQTDASAKDAGQPKAGGQ